MGFDREFCLCGVHVHTGTRVIAIVALVLSAMDFIAKTGFNVRQGASANDFLILILAQLFGLAPNVMLLYGNSKKRPNFYWPFIIINALGIILCVVLGLFILFFGGAVLGMVKELDDVKPPSAHYLNHPKGLAYGSQSAEITDEEFQDEKQMAKAVGTGLSIAMIGLSLTLFVVSAIFSYFLSVVIRGYQYLKENLTPETYNKLVEAGR